MANAFEEAVASLAARLGLDAAEAVADEHLRWQLYRNGIATDEGAPLVLTALCHEPNLPLASATVIWALEHRGAAERDRWIGALPPGSSSDYAKRRAIELAVAERLRDDPETLVSAADVSGWTQWLQLRVAEESESRTALAALEVAGATKRIRRVAHEKRSKMPRVGE